MPNRLILATGLLVLLSGCGGSDDAGGGAPAPAATTQGSPQPTPTTSGTTTAPVGTTTPPSSPVKPEDDPGAAPVGCSDITKDKNGFFTHTTSQGSYVGFVPTAYAGKPSMLVVGIHGCGDSALNFAEWAVNPYATKDAQTYIGISIGGRDGACWDTANDDPKVTAAIDDIKKCFYVHQHKVVLAGYSSGGILAYKMGLTDSAKYAGIIIENSGLEGTDPKKAAWKINVAHIAHQNDQDFPIAQTMADWAKLSAAGIPLQKSVVAGTHDGTSDDWANFLDPKIGSWISP